MKNFKKNYLTPGHPTAFGGINKLVKYYKAPKDDIKRQLESVEVYSTHYETKKPKRNPYYVWFRRQQFQIDLVEMGENAWYNSGVKYLLTCIDVFSKKAWVEPLKSKKAKETLEAFSRIVDRAGAPHTLISDQGTEIKNIKFDAYLQEHNIKQIFPQNEVHAAVVERFNKTLQVLIYKFLASKEFLLVKSKNPKDKARYLDQLQSLVDTYNNSFHRMIKMTPEEADQPANHHLVQAIHAERYKKIEDTASKRKRNYIKVGDGVRIKENSRKFARAYDEKFKDEIYIVKEINTKMPYNRYILQDITGQELWGSFYYEELVKVQDTGVYRVEKVLKRRKVGKRKEALVKWKGWDEKHNSWIT